MPLLAHGGMLGIWDDLFLLFFFVSSLGLVVGGLWYAGIFVGLQLSSGGELVEAI